MNEIHFTLFTKWQTRRKSIPLAMRTTRLLRFVVLLCIGLYGQNLRAQCLDCTGIIAAATNYDCFEAIPAPESLYVLNQSSLCSGVTVTVSDSPAPAAGSDGTAGNPYVFTRTYLASNMESCSHVLTVEAPNVNNPSITSCPLDQTINLTLGQCAPVITYALPTFTDGCSMELTAGFASGTVFPFGTTTVTYTVTGYPGTMDAICSFDVTVNAPTGTPSTPSCKANINVTVGPDCIAVITPDMVLNGGGYACYDDYTVVINGLTPASAITYDAATGAALINASAVTGFAANGMAGPFNVEVIAPNGSSCWNSGWMIEDKDAPVICCSDYEISCLDPTNPAQLTTGVTKTYTALGGPFSINEPAVGASFAETSIPIDVTDCPHAILDIDVVLNIDHDFISDYAVELISPNGTVVRLFNRQFPVAGGCLDANLNVTFDTEAATALTCGNTNPAFGGTYRPVGLLSNLYGDAADGIWTLLITSYVDRGTAPLGSVLNAQLIIEANYAFPVVEDCSNVTTTYTDNPLDPSLLDICDGQPIIRTWTTTDAKGKTAICTQTIDVVRPDLEEDIDCPANVEFSCLDGVPIGANGPDPAVTGEPTYEGEPISGLCMFLVSYEDNYSSAACTELYMRVWKITDMCTGAFINCMQSIKIVDDEGPSINGPADMTVSPPYLSNCKASVVLAPPTITDVCTQENQPFVYAVSTSVGGVLTQSNGVYTYSQLEVGNTYVVTYTAFDGCGNSSTHDFDITVADGTAPTPICGPNTITLNNLGSATINASVFGAASHDNCGVVLHEVRRVTSCSPGIPTTFGPSVGFSCCDAGTSVQVELRVWDAAGLSNTVTCTVSVSPYPGFGFAFCPPTTGPTLQCGNLSGLNTFANVTLTNTGIPVTHIDINGNSSSIGFYIANGVNSSSCSSLSVTITDVDNLNGCGVGTISRTYTVTDGANQTSSCPAIIYPVVNNTTFTLANINWPDDILMPGLQCSTGTDPDDLPAGSDYPQLINLTDCHNAAVATWMPAHDLVFEPSDPDDDYCYKILRNWTAKDWCTGVQFTHVQTIMVVDNTLPTVTCSGNVTAIEGSQVVATATATDNCTDAATLGISFTYQIDINFTGTFTPNVNGTGNNAGGASGAGTNFPVGTHRVRFFAEDACGNVGTCEIIVDVVAGCSSLLPDPVTFNVGSAGATFNANIFYASGIAPAGTTVTVAGNPVIDCNDIFGNAPTDITATVTLPGGVTCLKVVRLVDSTTPAVECMLSTIPISAAAGGGDIILSSIQNSLVNVIGDNCSSPNVAYFIGNQQVTTIPCVDGIVNINIVVTDDFNHSIASGLLDGNPHVCATTINVNCTVPQSSATVSGAIANEVNAMVENVTVSPASGMSSVYTNASGAFALDLPTAENYTITPTKNGDYLNGVSTYDIVLMSKHVLQTLALNSPYKIIAGDVNKSGTITTLDMVEVRKLILFINDEFPNNDSWRFVDANYVFPNPANPFVEIFPETYNINSLSSDMDNLDFVAVKVGDVNCSATTTGFAGDAEGRDFNGVLNLEMDDAQLSAGQTHTIEVKAKDFNQLLGYQFTMAFEGLEVLEVIPGELPALTEGNFGMQRLAEGVMTTSWNTAEAQSLADGTVLFSLTVKAIQDIKLSEVLRASSRLTTAEAYTERAGVTELLDVNFLFRNNNGITVAAPFELYQNRPNPFKNETVIGFDLPEAGAATLTVYDLSGRVLAKVKDVYAKGYNEVSINRAELPGAGVLYYELSTENNTAVRKMTIIE
jgi:Proprotein convertase P-domain/HYR domain